MPPTRRFNIRPPSKPAAIAAPPPTREAVPTTRPISRSTRVSTHEARVADAVQEAETHEVIGTRTVDAARLAHVRFGAGLTLNLGNYESARVDVQVELPCDMDNLEEALTEASEFVHARLAEEEARWATPR